MKRILASLLASVMVLSLAACGAKPAEPTPATSAVPEVSSASAAPEAAKPAKAIEEMTIGFSIHFKTDDYGAICTQGFEETCKTAGVKYEITDANGDPQKQLADIESLIAKQVDAIVVSPVDEKAIKDVCNKAVEKGIAVIPITFMPDTKAICTVETGNYEFAHEVATALAAKMGNKGKVAIITAPTILWRIDQRQKAFEDVIKANPEMELVSVEKKMQPDEAMAAAEALMAANPDIAGIWGTFSNCVYGPASAIKAANKPNIVVGGVDADMAILKLMDEGWIQYVAAQDPYSHGAMGAENAIKHLKGETVPEKLIAEYKIYSQDQAALCAEEIWNKKLEA